MGWNTDQEATANVIKYHTKLKAEYDISCKLVEEFFMSKIQQAIKDNDINAAHDILIVIPDSVTKAFALDAMRQRWKDYTP